MGNRKLSDYLDWLRVQYWIFAAPYLRGRQDIAQFCWSGHLELTERIAARDRAAVHRLLISYNQQSLEQMAVLCGEPLDDLDLTGFLQDHPEGVPHQRQPS